MDPEIGAQTAPGGKQRPGAAATPLARKLGIQPGHLVHLVDVPPVVDTWPARRRQVRRRASAPHGRPPSRRHRIAFYRSAAHLEEKAPAEAKAFAPDVGTVDRLAPAGRWPSE